LSSGVCFSAFHFLLQYRATDLFFASVLLLAATILVGWTDGLSVFLSVDD
jgi:hypothetical protein